MGDCLSGVFDGASGAGSTFGNVTQGLSTAGSLANTGMNIANSLSTKPTGMPAVLPGLNEAEKAQRGIATGATVDPKQWGVPANSVPNATLSKEHFGGQVAKSELDQNIDAANKYLTA